MNLGAKLELREWVLGYLWKEVSRRREELVQDIKAGGYLECCGCCNKSFGVKKRIVDSEARSVCT